jgi:hypothetical protein
MEKEKQHTDKMEKEKQHTGLTPEDYLLTLILDNEPVTLKESVWKTSPNLADIIDNISEQLSEQEVKETHVDSLFFRPDMFQEYDLRVVWGDIGRFLEDFPSADNFQYPAKPLTIASLEDSSNKLTEKAIAFIRPIQQNGLYHLSALQHWATWFGFEHLMHLTTAAIVDYIRTYGTDEKSLKTLGFNLELEKQRKQEELGKLDYYHEQMSLTENADDVLAQQDFENLGPVRKKQRHN